MSKRIPPKTTQERSWPGPKIPGPGDAAAKQSKNTNKINDINNNSALPNTPTGAQAQSGHFAQQDRMDSQVPRQHAGLPLGRAPAALINFARAHSEQADTLSGRQTEQKREIQTKALGGRGPVNKLDERSILQDMLQRLGGSLDDQMHNLVSGFLHSLPQKEATAHGDQAHSGQLGALAQVISLKDKSPRVLPHRLDLDPVTDPVTRQDLEDMLSANGARAQLLVALGAASETERAQLDAGKLTLTDFYSLAARGHFGQLAEQPVRYDVLRHKLASAGLDLEFHQLLQHLDDNESQKIIDGELSPTQAFAALARARGRQQ